MVNDSAVNNVQVIMKDGRPEWAVLPYGEYEALLDRLQQLQGGVAAVSAADSPAAAESLVGSEAGVDAEFSPARLARLRQQKGMELSALAQAVGISAHYLQQMESGEREPSEPILRNIARALQVEQNDLMG
ncbi:helix-turn-helix transcriptional regulator [Pseudomaricurvus sp. HS19]|uniref:helix-turn-helix domain-containing protein n=1 Tax=Pseudomaricurvus sp. HS19 TaxID=2692626 RepID=UPI0019266CDE